MTSLLAGTVAHGARGGRGVSTSHYCHTSSVFLSFFIYCLALAFEHYRQVYIVHSGLQDESLQVTISKLL